MKFLNFVNGKKIALVATSAALAVTCAVGGTMAWLNSITTPVNNTITLGKVQICLDESKLKPDGTLDTTTRVNQNNYTCVEPGVKELKDPTVHVTKGSEDCYIFLKVATAFQAKEATTAQMPSYVTLDQQIKNNKWEAYTPVGGAVPGYQYYIYKGSSSDYIFHATVDANLPVFANFAVNTTVAGGSIPNILVMAGAIQSNGFANKDAAFTALGL